MNIVPYKQFGNLSFGDSAEKARRLFGKPSVEDIDPAHQRQLHYSDFILRFNTSEDTFRGATLLPYAQATLNGSPLGWDMNFLKKICTEDGGALEYQGFIVLFRLGLTITGIHDEDDSSVGNLCFRQK